MQRLEDQVIIMRAILEVKKQLEACDPKEWNVQSEILLRLVTLYSLLDLNRIMPIVEAADGRDKGRKVA